MADTKISGLTALTGANTASGDLLTIVDVSDNTMAATGTNKKITLTELQGAPVSAGTANGVLYLNGSKVATSGTALVFDGTNLGVGVTPIYKLDVNGVTRLGAGSPAILAGVGGAFAGGQGELYTIGTNTMGIGTTGAASLRFYTASAEAARIDSSGNLGLGVTPSAWRSGAKAFQLGTTGYASLNEQANGSTSLNFNCYESAANTWTYFVTGVAPTRYTQLSGAHAWFTAGSGTAGNAITFTQAMTLDASGNLMVGTTTAVEKLTVNGRVLSQWDAYANGGNTSYAGDATSLVTGSSAGMWAARSDSALLFAISSNEKARIDSSGNLLVGTTSTPTSAVKVIAMGNATAPTASITGGILYVESGALKYRGSSGTVTTIAAA